MKTKVIATINPQLGNLDELKKLEKAGAKIVRVNLKYASFKQYEKIQKNVEKIRNLEILLDFKDRNKLNKIINQKFDWLAVSFAESSREIKRIRRMFKRKIEIISKIETKKGVKNTDELIEVSDGIMVARGDLGNEIKIEKIPMIQKLITKKCNKKKRFSITATEMMPSMVIRKRPSRAEVSDIVNAILEGSEALLLAEETAIGKHPFLVVETMRKIIKETEKYKEKLE